MPRTSLQRARAGAAPPRDNARPDPAAGLDMLLQIPLLRCSPPVKWEPGAPGTPPGAAGQPLAWPGGGSRRSCGAGAIWGSPCCSWQGFLMSPLEVTGREPRGLILGVGRWWPCGDT